MQKGTMPIDQLVKETRDWLLNASYSSSYLEHFRSTTNKLLKYATNREITYFTTNVNRIRKIHRKRLDF